MGFELLARDKPGIGGTDHTISRSEMRWEAKAGKGQRRWRKEEYICAPGKQSVDFGGGREWTEMRAVGDLEICR